MPDAATLRRAGYAIIALHLFIVVAPLFDELWSSGIYDWDEMEAHRYIVSRTLRLYHQLPFWNPYICGGVTAWGGIQGATNFISPWLPAYLLLPFSVAERIEVAGMAVFGVAGMWLWSSRLTKSTAMRVLGCVVAITNGRWALQALTGHGWHLYYAWIPWMLYFHDRLSVHESSRRRAVFDLVMGAWFFALMGYNGAIYPLPQAIVLFGLYAALLSYSRKRLRPLLACAAIGIIGAGLGAPKLVPVAFNVMRFPRPSDSSEVTGADLIYAAFTEHDQLPASRPTPIPAWDWQEYGIYIGLAGLAWLAFSMLFSRGRRVLPLRITGIVAFVLSIGAFHALSPWGLLHRLPIFKSQHVPSRWLYPALIFLAAAAMISIGSAIHRRARIRPLLEVIALAFATYVAVDIGFQTRRSLRDSFTATRDLRTFEETTGPFMQRERPRGYDAGGNSPTSTFEAITPASFTNVGVTTCFHHPTINRWTRHEPFDRSTDQGAFGVEHRRYRGEAYTASGEGRAAITQWTPNEVEVTVEGGRVGDLAVINQNWDEGWRVNGNPSETFLDAIAARITAPNERFVFRYVPKGFKLGICVGVATALGLLVLWIAARRADRV